MKPTSVRNILIGVTLVLAFIINPGCSNHTTKAQRLADKNMAKLEEQAQKEHEATVKAHDKIQSKSTRKMMKEAKRRAKKINKSLRRK
jgi:hypothetical protein